MALTEESPDFKTCTGGLAALAGGLSGARGRGDALAWLKLKQFFRRGTRVWQNKLEIFRVGQWLQGRMTIQALSGERELQGKRQQRWMVGKNSQGFRQLIEPSI